MELMDYQALGAHIRRQRKNLQMTQDELAEQAGISLSFMGHIERGSRKASIETLVRLANALNVSCDELLQDSLNQNILLSRQTDARQQHILQEISRVLRENLREWTAGAPSEKDEGAPTEDDDKED